jgi:hypothetical protein
MKRELAPAPSVSLDSSQPGGADATPQQHRKGGGTGPPRPGQMMHAPYYDRDANPVSQEQRRQLSRRPGYSRIWYADADPARPAGHRENLLVPARRLPAAAGPAGHTPAPPPGPGKAVSGPWTRH